MAQTENRDGIRLSEISGLGKQLQSEVGQMERQAQQIYTQLPQTEDLESWEKTAAELKGVAGELTKVSAQIYGVSDELSARCRDIQQQRKKRKFIATAPANSTIDLQETQTNLFAKGMGIYKLLLVCFIGSFAGVVVELLWCLIRHGYLESRSGLVYGPFNLLYGAGAVVLTVCLYRFRNHSGWISFLGGMIVGTVVEYVCSWGQEMIFGSRSWDYCAMPFNINGRVCLLYSVFWGFLGLFWIKNLYPRMAKWILKIPNKPGKIITVVLTVFLAWNSVVSLAAVHRWTERLQNQPASNAVEQLLDERFPNERLERIYANMEFGQMEEPAGEEQPGK